MIKISTFNYNKGTPNDLKTKKYGKNWPVVYIINSDKEAYVGETINVSSRTNQHLQSTSKNELDKITVISDDTFNKSSILDLESFLIKYMSADGLFKLQNGNAGLTNHNYYQKEIYQSSFKEIWNELRLKQLVKNDLLFIENTNLFKFSPYKSLSIDQYMVVNNLLSDLSIDIQAKRNSMFLINGVAGTGKTVLAIYLIKLLTNKDDFIKIEEDETIENIQNITKLYESLDNLKIALVIPMENLRETLKKVFKSIKGLNSGMVLSPHEIAQSNDFWDILIVDEAHRLKQRINLPSYIHFDANNKLLGLDKDSNQLDWIINKSKYQVIFYDETQTVRKTDVDKEYFDKLYLNSNNHFYDLESQLRCMKGGKDYIDYIKKLFSNNPPINKIEFQDYDFKLFDDVEKMIKTIQEKNNEYGLSRTVAGYSWEWKTKKHKIPIFKSQDELNEFSQNVYDIEIEGNRYIWNSARKDWLNSPNSIYEIGSIHTIQGYDLNYTGLIVGNELKYNPISKELYVDTGHYYDIYGKNKTNVEELNNFIFNIYSTMASRGILGTYLYICDDNLREYFKNYINLY